MKLGHNILDFCLQAIASHLPDTPMIVYSTGRWAHFNVKLHFFYRFSFLEQVEQANGEATQFGGKTSAQVWSFTFILFEDVNSQQNPTFLCLNMLSTSEIIAIG